MNIRGLYSLFVSFLPSSIFREPKNCFELGNTYKIKKIDNYVVDREKYKSI